MNRERQIPDLDALHLFSFLRDKKVQIFGVISKHRKCRYAFNFTA